VQVVVDASYSLAFLGNSGAENFKWVLENGLLAPCLLRYKCCNALLRKLKNDRKTIGQFVEVIHNMAIQ
jgi:hypothetical protein